MSTERVMPSDQSVVRIPEAVNLTGKKEGEQCTIRRYGLSNIADHSRAQFELQRDLIPPEENSPVVVSSSHLAIRMPDGSIHAVQLGELSPEDRALYENQMRANGHMTIIGATTFGRARSDAIFTTLSYVNIPIDNTTPLPGDLDDCWTKNTESFNVGYVRLGYPNLNNVQGDYSFIEHSSTNSPEEAQAFARGLTEDIQRLADVTLRMDAAISPIAIRLLERIGYNSLGHYIDHAKVGGEISEYYNKICQNLAEYTEKYGGNCLGITAVLLKKFAHIPGVDIQAVISQSNRPVAQEEHAAVALHSEGYSFMLETSLGIPFPIPYGTVVPIQPTLLHDGRRVYVGTHDVNGVIYPDIYTSRAEGKDVKKMTALSLVSPDVYDTHAARVLTGLHGVLPHLRVQGYKHHERAFVGYKYCRTTGLSQRSQSVRGAPIYLEEHSEWPLESLMADINNHTSHVQFPQK